MKAMILAAGLGTRLRPLTSDRPKALVEISGRTLLEITLSRLRKAGISEVIVNAHHFADVLVNYLRANDNFGMRIEISCEDVLLDTGGGLKKAAHFFLRDPADEPFILHNVDVLSTIDLRRMLRFHQEQRALATLAVQGRKTSRYLLFDELSELCGRRLVKDGDVGKAVAEFGVGPSQWTQSSASREATASESPARQCREGEVEHESASADGTHSVIASDKAAEMVRAVSNPQPLAFCGIHVISPRLLTLMSEEGVFSIIDTYLRLAAAGEKIVAFRADQYYWRDLGRPEHISQASTDLARGVLQLT